MDEYIEEHQDQRNEDGHRKVVKNDKSHNKRTIQTGAEPVELKTPRVDDRREEKSSTNTILPPYMCRSPGVDELVPVLYLYGVSTNDMTPALEAYDRFFELLEAKYPKACDAGPEQGSIVHVLRVSGGALGSFKKHESD